MIKLTVSKRERNIKLKKNQYDTKEKLFVFESTEDDSEILENLSPFLKRIVRQELDGLVSNGEYEFSVNIINQTPAGNVLFRNMKVIPLEKVKQ